MAERGIRKVYYVVKKHGSLRSMKMLLLVAFLFVVTPLLAVDDVVTTASLPNNTLIQPLPKIDDPDVLSVEATFKEKRPICSFVQGNWRTVIYLISYAVSKPHPQYPHPQITFIVQDREPTKESGIELKKVVLPFGEGAMTFFLERDQECSQMEFFRILSYQGAG